MRKGNRVKHPKRTQEHKNLFLKHPVSFAGQKKSKKEKIEAEMPAWMLDATLLPKRPPGK